MTGGGGESFAWILDAHVRDFLAAPRKSRAVGPWTYRLFLQTPPHSCLRAPVSQIQAHFFKLWLLFVSK